jgi:hypothetical protein
MTLDAEVAVLMVVLVVTISSCAVAGHATAAKNAAIRKEFVRIMFVDFAFMIVAPRKLLFSKLVIPRPAPQQYHDRPDRPQFTVAQATCTFAHSPLVRLNGYAAPTPKL